MNNLKFRAWDHVDNVMLFADIYEMQDISGEWTAWDQPLDSPTNTGTPFDIMQHSGIKDINGNEIYAGDIVSRVYRNSWDTEDRFQSPEVVEFSECDASIQGSVCDVPMLAFNMGGFPLMLDDKYKIVGNIYENKDLINHQ